jgi:sulfonate transport system substrate-binding protein
MPLPKVQSLKYPCLVLFVVIFAAALAVPTAGASTGQAKVAAAKSKVSLAIGDQAETLELPQQLSGQLNGAPYSVQWTTFTDGPHLNAAFVGHKIDVGYEGDSPALLATAGSTGVDVIAAQKERPDALLQIVARPGSGITSLADLKGKTVAETSGTALQGYLDQVLATVGLTQKDITVVNVPVTTLSSVLSSGNADAAVLADTQVLPYLAQNPHAVRLNAPSVTPYILLLATKQALANPAKREAILQFVARAVKAGRWVNAHESSWINADLVKLDGETPATARATFQTTGYPTWGPVTQAAISHQQTQAKLLSQAGELPAYSNIDKFVASQFNASINAQFNQAIQQAEK